MRVLVLSHYFPPEVGAPQARLSELARHWASAGDDVTVLTGMPNHPTGVIAPEYRRRLRASERADGYRIERSWVYATPNEGVLKKTLGHLSFMLTGPFLSGRRAGPVDVVVVSSPTFFSVFAARALARLRRARLVVEIRDLWPAAMVELGVLTNKRLIRVLEALELSHYRTADAVVVVSEGFRTDLVRRGVPASKVHTIRNGADIERFRPGSLDRDPKLRDKARRRLGASHSDFVVLYIGAHGISHALVSVVDAAAKLADDGVHLALVGDGAEKFKIEAHVSQLGAQNITMLPSVPREEVSDFLAAADVCLVPLRDIAIFETFIPSKMFEFLAAGRPVIGSVRGEAAGILREAGAMVVEPEDPAALAAAILELKADPDRRERMASDGRSYVMQHYDRARLAERYRDMLRSVVEAP